MGGRGKNPKKKQRKTFLYTCMIKKKIYWRKIKQTEKHDLVS